jgi:hypothetical protein
VEKKFYVINDGKYILMRFNTSAFGSKWCGLWDGNKKLVDYYALKVNDAWLGPHNCYRFVKINNMSEHFYKTDGFEAKERAILGNGLTIELNVKSKNTEEVRIGMEVGVNMRERCENAHHRKYAVDKNGEVKVVNEKGSLVFGSGDFEETDNYRTHYPGKYHNWEWSEEEQSVFVPGTLFQKGVSKNSGSLFRFYIERPAEKSEHKGFYQEGKGFLAGFPWFLQIWGRDSGFVIPAYTDMGKHEWSKNALKVLASHEKDGRIPNFIGEKPIYNSIDAGPLFVVACEHYVRKSEDKQFAEEVEQTISRILEKGMVASKPKETWMDTIDRSGHNIDVHAIMAEAFKCGYKLFGRKGWIGKYEILRKGINNDFWTGEYFLDTIGSEKRTANVLFPLFFGQIGKERAEKAFDVLESPEFLTEKGIRSVSNKDPSYDPKAYHSGMVWGLLTGMLAYAERLYGRKDKSEKILDTVKSNKNMRCIGGIDETYNGDTGVPSGCCSQAWSEIWETRINSEF